MHLDNNKRVEAFQVFVRTWTGSTQLSPTPSLPHPVDRGTDTSEKITYSHTTFVGGKVFGKQKKEIFERKNDVIVFKKD